MARGVRFDIGMCSGIAVAALTLCAATAASRNPNDYLTLDLKSAVLSPEPLGPATHFQPLGVEAHSDITLPAPAGEAPTKTAAAPAGEAAIKTAAAPAASTAPHVAHTMRHHFAQRHRSSPLDANAEAPRPRIQRWPCRASGICAWQKPASAR